MVLGIRADGHVAGCLSEGDGVLGVGDEVQELDGDFLAVIGEPCGNCQASAAGGGAGVGPGQVGGGEVARGRFLETTQRTGGFQQTGCVADAEVVRGILDNGNVALINHILQELTCFDGLCIGELEVPLVRVGAAEGSESTFEVPVQVVRTVSNS